MSISDMVVEDSRSNLDGICRCSFGGGVDCSSSASHTNFCPRLDSPSSHTTTTWMFSVLSDTTMSSRDMASTICNNLSASTDPEPFSQTILVLHSGAFSTRACAAIDEARSHHGDILFSGIRQSGRHVDGCGWRRGRCSWKKSLCRKTLLSLAVGAVS